MYVAPENINADKKEFIYEAIEDAYNKYSDKAVQVYQETIDKSKETCIGTWVNAKFVKAEAIQEIQIYLHPDGFTIAEWKDVMRVTPDHIFPVRTKNGIIEKYAYLLETGDELVFEDAQYKDERVDNVEGEQKLIYRTISKVVTENFDEPKSYYCFKVEDENIQPYFLLPNGCITHNCRLKNKIQTKEFNFTNGNLGVQTGSKSVISLNLSRITQDWFNSVKKNGITKENVDEHLDSLCEYLGNILERVYKYHIAYNELLWDMYDANLLSVYKAGFISLDKQYLTIGLNGVNQMAEFLGMTCNVNSRYEKLCQTIFGYIKKCNQEHAGKFNNHKLIFNTECVPAESLAIKNYNWDSEDGQTTMSM